MTLSLAIESVGGHASGASSVDTAAWLFTEPYMIFYAADISTLHRFRYASAAGAGGQLNISSCAQQALSSTCRDLYQAVAQSHPNCSTVEI